MTLNTTDEMPDEIPGSKGGDGDVHRSGNRGGNKGASKVQRVMTAIRAQIANRTRVADDRLPSVRSLAARLAVSPSTVVEAYDRLVAEGLIYARRGSGFYVAASHQPPLTLAALASPAAREVDPLWVSRQSLDSDDSTAKPGCGWLPASWMPEGDIRRALRAVTRGGNDLLVDYGGTRGSAALRHQLLASFALDGLQASPDQLLLAQSGTQAIDLICRYLLRPGDTVLIDDPCYFNFRALLRAHQVTIVGVPYTPNGPDLTRFESILTHQRPKLYLTNSALHNPTGATLSLPTAHRLLTLAAAHDMVIVEDDIFADFEPEPSPRLAALDGLQQVIRIGSFSKTLSASLRCGYIAARREWVEDLIDLQVATNFGGPSPLITEVISQVMASGSYRKHMQTLRSKLARRRQDVATRLQSLGITPWLMPRGGFYLWCQLPTEIDATEMARAALTENVVLAPGNVFSVSETAESSMRVNVAQCEDERIWRVVQQALNRVEASVRLRLES